MPFYTDPESTHIFTIQKRSKKRFRPIEGHEMTMHTSQPAQIEATPAEVSADDAATTDNAHDDLNRKGETTPTNEVTSEVSATSDAQPDAESSVEYASATSAPTQASKDESQPPLTAPTATGTAGDSTPDTDKDEKDTASGSVGEPTPPAVKPEAIPARPKTWAHLLKKDPVASKAATDAQAATNGSGDNQTSGELGSSHPNTRALADVLRNYDPSKGKAIFIEPRGLYNARVDCYMISVSCF